MEERTDPSVCDCETCKHAREIVTMMSQSELSDLDIMDFLITLGDPENLDEEMKKHAAEVRVSSVTVLGLRHKDRFRKEPKRPTTANVADILKKVEKDVIKCGSSKDAARLKSILIYAMERLASNEAIHDLWKRGA